MSDWARAADRWVKRLRPDTAAPEPKPEWPVPRLHLEFLHGQLQAALARQIKELETLDGKHAIILGSTVVLLGLVVGALPYLSPTEVARHWALAAMVLLVGSTISGVIGVWPRTLQVAPTPEKLWKHYYAKTTEETLATLGSTLVEAIQKNAHVRKSKGLSMRLQMTLLILGVVALTVSMLRASGIGQQFAAPPWW